MTKTQENKLMDKVIQKNIDNQLKAQGDLALLCHLVMTRSNDPELVDMAESTFDEFNRRELENIQEKLDGCLKHINLDRMLKQATSYCQNKRNKKN